MQCKHWSILGCATAGNAVGMEEEKIWHDAGQEPPPEKNKYYLVYDYEHGMFGVSEYYKDLVFSHRWKWWIEGKDEDFYVTHYCELPEPPK